MCLERARPLLCHIIAGKHNSVRKYTTDGWKTDTQQINGEQKEREEEEWDKRDEKPEKQDSFQ